MVGGCRSVRMVKYDQPIMKLLPGAPEPSYHLQAMEGPGEYVAPEYPQTNTNRNYLFRCSFSDTQHCNEITFMSQTYFQHMVCSVGEVVGVRERPAGASVTSIMETQRMFSGQGHERMSLRWRVGVVHLTLLLPCSVGRWSRKMVWRKRLSLLLPLQT